MNIFPTNTPQTLSNLEIRKTEDGSDTLFNKELNESYHSTHGAVQESNHVFINAGFHYVLNTKSTISILEMGFGTGLNAFLTALECKKLGVLVKYTSIENRILEPEIWKTLRFNQNYGADIYRKLHECSWNKFITINADFELHKIQSDIENWTPISKFDLIYYDAFAPEIQPHLWSESIFKKLFDAINPNGILVTYCAKGAVKRALKASGFMVEALPGPPGKREITRAIKVG